MRLSVCLSGVCVCVCVRARARACARVRVCVCARAYCITDYVSCAGNCTQGFFFSPDDHYKDRVLCAFCNLELAEWGPKDDPIYEHGVRSPACPVVTGKIMSIQSRDPERLKEIVRTPPLPFSYVLLCVLCMWY